MPMPVSVIDRCEATRRDPPSPRASVARARRPRLRSVNFTALPTRLVRIWRSRPGSPRDPRRRRPRWITVRELEALAVAARSASSSSTSSTADAQVEVDHFEVELAGLDLREVENVVDDRQQRLAGPRGSSRRTRAARRSASVSSSSPGQTYLRPIRWTALALNAATMGTPSARPRSATERAVTVATRGKPTSTTTRTAGVEGVTRTIVPVR